MPNGEDEETGQNINITEQVCFLSMMSSEPKYCQGTNCTAFFKWGNKPGCLLLTSINSFSFNMRKIGNAVDRKTGGGGR
jgi:hypothetical protein